MAQRPSPDSVASRSPFRPREWGEAAAPRAVWLALVAAAWWARRWRTWAVGSVAVAWIGTAIGAEWLAAVGTVTALACLIVLAWKWNEWSDEWER